MHQENLNDKFENFITGCTFDVNRDKSTINHRMAEQNLEALTIEQLRKKEKTASILLIIMLIVLTVCIVILLIVEPYMAACIAPLWITMLPIGIGRKKAREELKRRGVTD